MTKTIKYPSGVLIDIRDGDRFLWHTHKWYVVDFIDCDQEVAVRFDGTADVVTLPETFVGELVNDYNSLMPSGI